MAEENVITRHALEIAMCAALGLDPQRVARIVIDMEAGRQPDVCRVYVEMIGDERLLLMPWDALMAQAEIEWANGHDPR